MKSVLFYLVVAILFVAGNRQVNRQQSYKLAVQQPDSVSELSKNPFVPPGRRVPPAWITR